MPTFSPYEINQYSDAMLKYLPEKAFVAWSCNECDLSPLTDYIKNLSYQELPTKPEYISSNNEIIYLDLRASCGYAKQMEKLERNDSKLNLKMQLKSPETHKLRLRIWGYSLGEYLYISAKDGITLQHKTYSIM